MLSTIFNFVDGESNNSLNGQEEIVKRVSFSFKYEFNEQIG